MDMSEIIRRILTFKITNYQKYGRYFSNPKIIMIPEKNTNKIDNRNQLITNMYHD